MILVRMADEEHVDLKATLAVALQPVAHSIGPMTYGDFSRSLLCYLHVPARQKRDFRYHNYREGMVISNDSNYDT